jgi:hypothetical protein
MSLGARKPKDLNRRVYTGGSKPESLNRRVYTGGSKPEGLNRRVYTGGSKQKGQNKLKNDNLSFTYNNTSSYSIFSFMFMFCISSLSLCAFSFGHCVVCSSSLYEFWLPLWCIRAPLPTIYDTKMETWKMEYKHCIWNWSCVKIRNEVKNKNQAYWKLIQRVWRYQRGIQNP